MSGPMPDGTETPNDSPKPPLVPQPGGRGAIYQGGVPGNRGGGRTPDEFRQTMEALGKDPVALDYMRACVRGEHGPKAAIAAYKYATEQAHGKATTKVEVGGGSTPVSVVIRKE